MRVYWMEQGEANVPAANSWLSARETICLDGLRFAKRRTDWRLGRWTAKRAVAALLELPTDLLALQNIEILAAASGAPEVFLLGQRASLAISLSHSAGAAVCAIARSEIGLGCDLERIEPRSNAFLADYFTANEHALVGRVSMEERPLLETLIWSAKESALKALHEGLRLDTNCMDVDPVGGLLVQAGKSQSNLCAVALMPPACDDWRLLQVCYSGAQVFRGWWRHDGQLVRTIVAPFPFDSPVELDFRRESRSCDVRAPLSHAEPEIVSASTPCSSRFA